MPKQPIPPHYAKAQVFGRYEEATWANVLYFDASPSDPTHPFDAMAAVQAAVFDFYESVFSPLCSAAWSVDTTKIFYRADPTSSYSTTVADAIGGTGSGSGAPAQVAYLINWVSGDSRRGGKPRQYVPGVLDSALGGTTDLTSAACSAINTAIAEWLTDFPVSSGTGVCNGLVEMSFVSNKVDLSPPIARPIIAGTCNPILGTQRRRVDRQRV